MVEDCAFSHKINCLVVLGDSKSRRASKLHYLFKRYGNFSERGDFAYRWSCIRKGLRLQPARVDAAAKRGMTLHI